MKNRAHILATVGLALVAFGAGADLIGFGGRAGFGLRQTLLVLAGFSLAMAGIVIDLALGPRRTLEWLKRKDFGREDLGRFLVIVVVLGLIVLVIRRYELETRAFYHNIALLTFFGFLIHHFLPGPYRLPFFLVLSLAGITGVFGIQSAIWLMAVGAALVGICHLPIPYRARAFLLLAAGAGLAILRAGWVKGPWPAAIWPILASMFMFRLIIYMYDLKHGSRPANPWEALSYFFLLPNTVFPFFPVVDSTVFRKTYFNEDRYEIYQRGLAWMVRGVIHLLLYRIIYQHLVISPEEVTDAGDLIRFLVTNFLLYLRISGMFHLIVGMLHLFGFNLPETNRRYCLSSSFIDFWRRINIYWKDFMQKVFFNPISFRLRHLGLHTSLVIATLCVFLVTWFFHAYQWFWIRGSWLLSTTDILFWTILAVLVTANYLYGSRFAGKPARVGRKWTIGDSASQVARTLATFGVICVLWSLWTSASLGEWFSIWSLGETPAATAAIGSSIILLAIIGLVFTHYAFRNLLERRALSFPRLNVRSFPRLALANGSLILLLYLPTLPPISRQLGDGARKMVATLRTNRLSRRDEELVVRGYYEDLTNVNRFNSQLWEVYMLRPQDWPDLWDVDALRLTGDFLRYELRPSLNIIFKGEHLHTNRWGMRDRDCEIAASPHTYRIALSGASHSMGSGVADDETFESLLEERLNREIPGDLEIRYEILNFGVDGYNSLQQLAVLEKKILTFKPNSYFYVAHEDEGKKSLRFLAERARDEVEIPYEPLNEILRKAGISPKMTDRRLLARLQPYREEIVCWTYRRIVDICREHGMQPVWVFLPDKVGITSTEETHQIARIAAEAGFHVVNLSDVYDQHDPETLRLTAWDLHPNAVGHQLIAERLFERLHEKLYESGASPIAPSPERADRRQPGCDSGHSVEIGSRDSVTSQR